MEYIIEIQHISKQYKLQHLAGGYMSLRERLLNGFNGTRATSENFLALNDVSFNIKPGESIGIIGRNGAGKSTLLKILSKITPPTSGRIVSRGRIASLLEVGTGFHPELTGRENIFFNGSLLGMKRREIINRFDEIVDFSGTEKFLDTALKHYSSGMQLRLAFAVAAFLEPEILVIDEVLAVGDAEFQRKCIGKMEDVTKSGRTILFVSHNMGMVKQLCPRTVWLEKGAVKMEGPTEEVTNSYLFQGSNNKAGNGKHLLGAGVSIEHLMLADNPVRSLSDTRIDFTLRSERKIVINSIGFFINNARHERVGIIDLRKNHYRLQADEPLHMKINLRKLPLIEGEYGLGVFLGSDLLSGNFEDLVKLQMTGPHRNSDVLEYPLDVRGKLELDYDFDITKD